MSRPPSKRRKTTPARLKEASPSSNPTSLPLDMEQLMAAMVPAITKGVVESLQGLGVLQPPNQGARPQPPHSPETRDEQSGGATQTVSAEPSTTDTVSTNTSMEQSQVDRVVVPAASIGNSNTSVNAASSSRPLALRVDSKVKSKIWAGEYVDLYSLISSKETSPLELHEVGGALLVKKTSSAGNGIRTIDQWFRAYHIFVSIYSEKFPNSAPALMKHADTVQKLSKLSGEGPALYYDEEFRRMKELHGDALSYSEMHHESYNQALARGLNRAKVKINQPFRPKSGGPKPPCFSYNAGKCTRKVCSYSHVCRRCGGKHPKKDCHTGQDLKKPTKPYTRPM